MTVRCAALCALVALSAIPLLLAQEPEIGHRIAIDLQSGKAKEASELADRALRSAPGDARLLTLKGVALVQLGRRAEALTYFARALGNAPEYLPALQGAAQIEYENEPARAAPLLRRILRLRPDDRTSHAMLASIALQTGDCDTVRQEAALSQPEAAALQAFGSCLIKQKRMPEAISAFQRLAALQPDERSIYCLAVAEFLAGQFTEVIRALESAMNGHTATPDMLELLAESYDLTSEPLRAINVLKMAISASPNVASYYTDFAYMCQARGWFQQGIDMLNRGLETLPNAASLYVARGVLYSELSKWTEGEADFARASQLDPDLELGSEAKGLAELQQSDLTSAEKTARERLKQHPRDAFLYYLLAEVLVKKGVTPGSAGFDEALRAAAKAVELKPDLLLAHNVLARLYLENGQAAKAAEQSRIVYQANPADQTALYHLILALRKAGPSPELPDLLKQLAQLKERSRKKDDLAQKAEALTAATAANQP